MQKLGISRSPALTLHSRGRLCASDLPPPPRHDPLSPIHPTLTGELIRTGGGMLNLNLSILSDIRVASMFS